MKSVLISIQPKWCELIASGKKTIEVRKTAPKVQTPFKCYIYKTKKRILRDIVHKGDSLWGCNKIADKTEIVSCPDLDGGKVIGEFVCDRIDKYSCEFGNNDDYMSPFHAMEQIRILDYVDEDDSDWEEYAYVTGNEVENPDDCELCKQSCLTYAEIRKYVGIGDKTFYGWHISDLKIYDKPKELGEFHPYCNPNTCINCKYFHSGASAETTYCSWKPLTRPFQSWGYIEEL